LPFTLRLYFTLSLLAPQLGVLALVGSVITFSFALALTTMYGTQDIGFRDVPTSCETLFGLFWPSLADPLTASKSSRYNFLVVAWVMVCVMLLWNLVISLASISMAAAAKEASKDEATISECFDIFVRKCSDSLTALKVSILKLPIVQRFLRRLDMDPVVPVNRKLEQQKSMQDRIANLSAGISEVDQDGLAAAGVRNKYGKRHDDLYPGVDWNASLVSAAQMETLEQQVVAITAALNKLTGAVATLSASGKRPHFYDHFGSDNFLQWIKIIILRKMETAVPVLKVRIAYTIACQNICALTSSLAVSRRKVFSSESNDTFPVRAAPSIQESQVIRNLAGLSSKGYHR
jgi:hypothetical protein